MMEHIVVDTNSLIMMVSSRTTYHRIWQTFLDGGFCMCVSNDILEEYAEVLARNISVDAARYVIYAIMERRNTLLVTPYFRWNLITADPDDNKFVDCAIAAGARYLVTEDHHFDVLRTVKFPQVDVIGIDAYLKQIENRYN